MSDKLMSVVMLNWNRLHYSKITLERLLATVSIRAEIILVDNNSMPESGVQAYLLGMREDLEKKFERVVYQFNDTNKGVAGGRNSGLVLAKGDYLMTIDDDVLLEAGWDSLMAEACDKIPGLGITGVNVEPVNYKVKVINGVSVRPKAGNLGGACLCIPRRVFKRVGYYNYFTLYSHEDSAYYFRLHKIGLMSAYIAPRGKHLDVDADKAYRSAKNAAHKKGSIQLQELSRYLKYMRSTGDVYVAYDPDFTPVDKDIFTNELMKKG